MKKYLLLYVLILLIAFISCSREERVVNIKVIAKNLPKGTVIYITGNDDQIGNWQPAVRKLDENKKGEWSKSFSFPKNKKLEFKITRGGWDKEALNDDGTTPSNYSITVTNDTSILITVNLWADQVEKKIEGQITGKVKYHYNFKGKGIKPRDIIVWLPPGYETENKSYPVLYMHDGQNIVDPKTSSFRVDWQIDEAADTLIKKGFIEPIIIVGIYNTVDRNDEYNEGSLGEAYMNFIIDSLKPFIDRNYRTKPDKFNTANGGASLGGLIAFILMWEHSDVFAKALCFSPAFKIDNYDFTDNVKAYHGKKKRFKLYIYNGDNELDSSLQPGVDEIIKQLKGQGYVDGQDFELVKVKNAQHGERDWSKNIPKALIFLFGNNKSNGLL
jgi:predicted alpha/beta superfamily hydrolase